MRKVITVLALTTVMSIGLNAAAAQSYHRIDIQSNSGWTTHNSADYMYKQSNYVLHFVNFVYDNDLMGMKGQVLKDNPTDPFYNRVWKGYRYGQAVSMGAGTHSIINSKRIYKSVQASFQPKIPLSSSSEYLAMSFQFQFYRNGPWYTFFFKTRKG
jgi:hypothetical protein